jgi:hypothetical protein
MLEKPLLDLGHLKGLIYRRLKWHRAEYNRILASWDRLPRETAQEAAGHHAGAIMELRALCDMREPDWGTEREITERYLYWNASNPSQEAVQERIAQEPSEPADQAEETGAGL